MRIYRNQTEVKDVNGCSNEETSPSRAFHEPRVMPDRYQATAGETKLLFVKINSNQPVLRKQECTDRG